MSAPAAPAEAGTAVPKGAFHSLPVTAVDPLAEDAVALSLAVPAHLRPVFRYLPGQHMTVRVPGAAEEVRRTYSICTPALDPDGPRTLTVGVRRVPGGRFSGHALERLAVGDRLEVGPPTGRFVLPPRHGRFAAVVGGSGITPVLSMAATLLAREPRARFTLVRSDRSVAATMFLDEVADLKDRWPDRFQVVQTLSREEQHTGLPTGRLDAARLTSLLPALLPVAEVDDWFLCGPHGLVRTAREALGRLGVPAARVHREIFHPEAPDAAASARADAPPRAATSREAELVATLGGRSGRWPVRPGDTLLEALLRHRGDAPYACKGGVCGTCRARLVTGEVTMDHNYALEPDEVAAGYVLACQARPRTDTVELDFDA